MKLRVHLDTILRDWYELKEHGIPGQVGPKHFMTSGGEYDGSSAAFTNRNIVEAGFSKVGEIYGSEAAASVRGHITWVAEGKGGKFGDGMGKIWDTFTDYVLKSATESYKSLRS